MRKLLNKFTLLSIGCTIFPVMVQNIYNLFYTNPGRQVFYEDIESFFILLGFVILAFYDVYSKSKKIEESNLK